MKVAFASDDGLTVNTHFGYAASFEVYEITTEKYEKLPKREVKLEEEESENSKIENRLHAVLDCTLLFINQIGPAAAARVTRNQIMPIKVDVNTSIQEQLERLLQMLQNKPPMWLAKAMQSVNEGESTPSSR